MRGGEGPNVSINRQHDGKTTSGKGPLQYSNAIYDARKNYSELENADLRTSLDLPDSNQAVKVDMKDGMTGMVNPYVEALETERKLAGANEEGVVTIGSTTNLKSAALVSLDDEKGVKLGRESVVSSNLYQSNSIKPMVVKVRSVSEDSGDFLGGFANPCATGDDYIFSEDDTREALDITGGSEKRHVEELNANDFEKIPEKDAVADHNSIHWTEVQKGPKQESNA